MRSLTFCLLATLSITLPAQEDVEQYLLTDSLEIEALIEGNVLLDNEEAAPAVTITTKFGLIGKQYSKLGDLNASLLSAGYGEIPDASLGWIVGNQVHIGDRLSVGTTIFSNVLLNRVNEGLTNSSKYLYVSFLLDFAYQQTLGGFRLAPGLGLGFTQNYLTLQPNGRDEMDWDDLYINDGLMVTVRQVDFAVSTDLSITFLFPKKAAKKHNITLKTGLLFHPFSFVKPGVYTSEGNSVKLNKAPSLNSTGFHLMLTWG